MKYKGCIKRYTECFGRTYIFRCGLVVRIPGFHPGGPGSIPGIGTTSFIEKSIKLYLHITMEEWNISIM